MWPVRSKGSDEPLGAPVGCHERVGRILVLDLHAVPSCGLSDPLKPDSVLERPEERKRRERLASGGHLWACRMSADMQHLTESDLREDVEGIISASDFIELTEGAQLLFI